MSNATKKADRKKTMIRIICLVVSVVMVGSVLLAALLAQPF